MSLPKIVLILVFCFGNFIAYTQTPEKPKKKFSYWNYLRYPKEKSQSHLFFGNCQFIYSASGTSLGAKGTLGNIGFNVTRLFTTKIILGAVIELKNDPGYWNIKPSGQFVTDFNNSFIASHANGIDSLNAAVLKNAFNNTEGQSIKGQKIFNYGIALSLFPQKFGGILLQVKTGNTAFQINGLYGKLFIKGGGHNKVNMPVTGNMIYEISVKPYAFFKNAYIRSDKKRKGDFIKSIMLSFYYEELNFKSAEFNGTKMEQIVTADFLNKYGIDKRYGFKIGFGFY